jgi:hypothetical protein
MDTDNDGKICRSEFLAAADLIKSTLSCPRAWQPLGLLDARPVFGKVVQGP